MDGETSLRPVVLSGVQPTGDLHLGNYLGAVKSFVELQNIADCFYCVVDLHAITVKHDPAMLRHNTRLVAAAYIAAGVDYNKSPIFVQSTVPAHAELAWIFNCVARMGWMERMPQFQDKAGENSERASVGLFSYPILQAADILLYRANIVPVGVDQLQHLQLTQEIARKFNHEYRVKLFPKPEPFLNKSAPKIMSLYDGTKKMSKSDPDSASRINLMDTPDQIAKKIRKATADIQPLPLSVEAGFPNPSVENLVNIYAALAGIDQEGVLKVHGGQGYGVFKKALTDVLVDHLTPIRETMISILNDGDLDSILNDCNQRAAQKANETLVAVKDVLGLWS